MRLVELKNLLLHLFVLIGREGPLGDVVQRPRLLGLIVAEFGLIRIKDKDIQYLHWWRNSNSIPNTVAELFTCSVYEPSSA